MVDTYTDKDLSAYSGKRRPEHERLLADLLGRITAVVTLGNEIVARYRIRVGRRIGSAALVADGLHARTDGYTSLAVLAVLVASPSDGTGPIPWSAC